MSALNSPNNSRIHENPFRVSIPTFAHRGSGLDGHYEFEVKVSTLILRHSFIHSFIHEFVTSVSYYF